MAQAIKIVFFFILSFSFMVVSFLPTKIQISEQNAKGKLVFLLKRIAPFVRFPELIRIFAPSYEKDYYSHRLPEGLSDIY